MKIVYLALGIIATTPVAAQAAAVTFSDRAAFTAAATGPITTETFAGFPVNVFLSTPVTLTNSTYTADSPAVVTSGTFCPVAGDACISGGDIVGPRTFNNLLSGAAGFAFDLKAVSSINPFEITIVTGGGTQTFTLSDFTFFGIADTSGISSVSIRNLGTSNVYGNYGFDNVSVFTGAVTPGVPEPATWAMMMLGFGGVGYAMRRKPKASTRIRFA